MARTIEQIAQEQLGSLMLELAGAHSKLEHLTEENQKLKAQIAAIESAAKASKKAREEEEHP